MSKKIAESMFWKITEHYNYRKEGNLYSIVLKDDTHNNQEIVMTKEQLEELLSFNNITERFINE